MMTEIRFYLALFWRRLPLFLLVFLSLSAIGVFAAFSLPPVYQSQARLLVESAQIPGDLAESTVDVAAREQLQIFETRLLTRDNLLDVANRLRPFADQGRMNPDEIVEAMRSATSVRSSTGRDQATLMTLSFDSPRAGITAAVLDEYLTFLQEEDAQYRSTRAGQTERFFRQEVTRLGDELSQQSARILSFKNENAAALPEGLNYLRTLQLNVQDRIAQIDREVSGQIEQRERLIQVFDATGRTTAPTPTQMSPEERRLAEMRVQLTDLEAVYSDTNPRVLALRNRVLQLEQSLDTTPATETEVEAPQDPAQIMFGLQVSEIETRLEQLAEEKTRYEAQLVEIETSIAATPANAIALEALNRDYDNIQAQYNTAVDRLARASTGERIETLSQGQRVTVIEQPAIPSDPYKPNRKLVAAGGVLGGAFAGMGLIVALEFLSSAIKRPADLVRGMGITPLATIPYMRTRREKRRRFAMRSFVVIVIFLTIPGGLYAFHVYYMPLDVVIARLASRFGFYL
ncbi:GumC family protein [Aestuariibius sp. HNIBRBA575]|uniref:GumC family protein n=1 Tax=Aestuariibius sp. HNIBRBA575 TaxID=3233343 RepID=UPI0034A37D66